MPGNALYRRKLVVTANRRKYLDGLHHATQAVGTEQVNIQNVPAFRVIQFIQPKFAALMDLRCAGAKHTASIIPVVRMAGYFIVNTCGYS